ncbi:hypothetical protein GCM10008983_14200 [Lentibacillus halophilus]|uniref:Uncharacterized protein n=1 Tax=Lentibacillus halophilus TaxID=295065 RepID=A0ABP3J2L8_9BACI
MWHDFSPQPCAFGAEWRALSLESREIANYFVSLCLELREC